jgi:non-heme chloroperoxidase
LPIDVFDGIRAGTLGDRSQFFKDLALAFYGYNRDGAKKSQGVIDNFWYQGMQGGIKGLYDCVKAFSETDFTEDLKSLKIPVLFLHADDDQIVPIDDAAKIGHTLVPGSTLVILPGQPHGMCTVDSDAVNAEILKFIQG